MSDCPSCDARPAATPQGLCRRCQDQLRFITRPAAHREAWRRRQAALTAEHAEWEADKAQFRLVQKLFAMDDRLKATDIFLWSNVFKELGRLANHAEKTADRLRRMMHLES